jgi:hypothetical protein
LAVNIIAGGLEAISKASGLALRAHRRAFDPHSRIAPRGPGGPGSGAVRSAHGIPAEPRGLQGLCLAAGALTRSVADLEARKEALRVASGIWNRATPLTAVYLVYTRFTPDLHPIYPDNRGLSHLPLVYT